MTDDDRRYLFNQEKRLRTVRDNLRYAESLIVRYSKEEIELQSSIVTLRERLAKSERLESEQPAR